MTMAITRGGAMRGPSDRPQATARQARLVGLVLIATMVLWMAAQAVGGQMGWSPRAALLVDLAALAGFLWALITTYQIWRKRRA
ncbi:MAG: DUF5337 domain-containing protein [Paracoccaceae bacterium]